MTFKTAEGIAGAKEVFAELWERANKIIAGTTAADITSKRLESENREEKVELSFS